MTDTHNQQTPEPTRTSNDGSDPRRPTASLVMLISFLVRDGNLLRSPVLAFAVLASFTRSTMIFAINAIAGGAALATGNIALLIGSIVATLTFSHLARVGSFRLVETTKRRLRVRLTRRLLDARADYLARRDQGKVYSTVTQGVNHIANASTNFIESLEACLLIAFCIPYLFYLSWPSGVATLAAVALGAVGYILAQRPAQATAEDAARVEWDFFDRVNDALRGYKEVRLRTARKTDLLQDVEEIATRERELKVVSERYFSLGNIIGQGAMMGLLSVIVVGLPLLAGTDTATVLQLLTVVLLTYGPIETVLSNLSSFARAAVAKRLIDDLERDLIAESEKAAPQAQETDNAARFAQIEFRGVGVTLTSTSAAGDDESFTVGPIDLTFTPGEVVFICGGNGAGKSTLISALTGLRTPDQGEIWLDGARVSETDLPRYRSLFSAVFSDFHLFSKLYGLSGSEREALPTHLAALDLADRVRIEDDRFSNLALSSGQKRRVALSVALAEQHPIIVLDEFAADQDPVRRALFYDILVPQMARDGHLVIAVTHDEHRFEQCDRLIRMESGKVVSDTRINGGARKAV